MYRNIGMYAKYLRLESISRIANTFLCLSQRTKRCMFIIVCFLVALFMIFPKGTDEVKEKSAIGISLPSQRSSRWVRDRNAFYQYAKKYNIDIVIRFSDDDKYLQAYQIKKLANSGIDVLIVAASNSDEIVDALEYAKLQGVFIMAYDSFIVNTFAVDFYIAFNLNTLGLVDASQMVQIEALKQVINENIEFTWLLDSGVLAETSLILANEFRDSPPNMRDYDQINNGTRYVFVYWIEPLQVTKQNYKSLLIDTGIVTEADLGLEEP